MEVYAELGVDSCLYVDDNGDSPIVDFLESLDPETQARFAWSIEQLRLRNVQAREPLVRHVEGKLWELREESRTNIFRLMYFFYTGQRIIFVHGFQKKTQKTPRREIGIALERMSKFIEGGGGM